MFEVPMTDSTIGTDLQSLRSGPGITWLGRQIHIGRQERQLIDQLTPGLALGRFHYFPALSIFQKLLAIRQAQAGEFFERAQALRPLSRAQSAVSAERLFYLA